MCGVWPLASATRFGLLSAKREVCDIMRLETVEIRIALTLYGAPNSNEDTFSKELCVFKLDSYVSMSAVPNSRAPGRRSQYILHTGANICGSLVWKLRHVSLDWNFEVRFSESLYTPDLLLCMCCMDVCVSVDIMVPQQCLVVFVNVAMKQFS